MELIATVDPFAAYTRSRRILDARPSLRFGENAVPKFPYPDYCQYSLPLRGLQSIRAGSPASALVPNSATSRGDNYIYFHKHRGKARLTTRVFFNIVGKGATDIFSTCVFNNIVGLTDFLFSPSSPIAGRCSHAKLLSFNDLPFRANCPITSNPSIFINIVGSTVNICDW
jgi:hypothetical protein